jgi:hypothetical protein
MAWARHTTHGMGGPHQAWLIAIASRFVMIGHARA